MNGKLKLLEKGLADRASASTPENELLTCVARSLSVCLSPSRRACPCCSSRLVHPALASHACIWCPPVYPGARACAVPPSPRARLLSLPPFDC